MSGIFDHTVLFVAHLGNFANRAEAVARAKVAKGVAVLLYEGNGDDPTVDENLARMRAGYGADLRRLGFSVGVWANPRGKDPALETAAISRLYGELGLSFAVLDCELEYKSNGGGASLRALLKAWRARRPKAYTGISSYGYPDAAMELAAIPETGCLYLPQSYWLYDARFDPSVCIRDAPSLGIPKAIVHPTIEVMEGHSLNEGLIRLFESRKYGFLCGFSLYTGEQLIGEHLRILQLARSLSA